MKLRSSLAKALLKNLQGLLLDNELSDTWAMGPKTGV